MRLPLQHYLVSRRDALIAGIAFALMLHAAGGLALETKPFGGFSQPVFAGAPSGDSRLFIVEKGGAIKVLQPDGTVSTFLNIGSTGANLVNTSGERGLLGLAFDPNFSTPGSSGYGTFYVNYIDRSSTNNTVVARFQVSGANPNLADLSSRQTILTVQQPAGRNNHKAGWIGFRPGEPDNLYIATGDGGSGNDPDNLAQDLGSNLGKMLRINVRGDDFGADPERNYSIPAGNPFVGKAGNDEIWAYGLRNPFRNGFDRQTGDLWIADVGQGAREEIDFEPASFAGGANYGWRLREGTIETPATGIGGPKPADNRDPVLDYDRSFGASVIGGSVYRGSLMPDLEGAYIFGDYVSSRIWAIRYAGAPLTMADAIELTDRLDPEGSIGNLVAFGEDGRGELLLVDIGGGQILTMVPEPGTWGLLAAGMALLGWRIRQRGA
jgi:glucose/arabinose dehydrogenase